VPDRLLAIDVIVRRAARRRAGSGSIGSLFTLHVLFAGADEAAEGKAAGMITRHGLQFHWANDRYPDFDAFLGALSHDKRKKIRQERRKLPETGVTFERKTGAAIGPDDWSLFFRCYEGTYRAHHSTPYLSKAFFERLGDVMPENLLLVIGTRDGTPICTALDVYTSDTLWGRYWGTLDYVPGLHFEACYYQAIEFQTERDIARFRRRCAGRAQAGAGTRLSRRIRCTPS
jgi:predicted N-acyltransferase